MKKALIGVLTAVLVFGAGTMDVSAAGGHHGRHHAKVYCEKTVCCGDYADADSDGICDSCRAVVCCADYADADCDGICDSCGGTCKVYRAGKASKYRGGCGRRCHR